ncbi:hypothetical protein LguiA_006115 [Lonicera macranthoides]
MKQNPASISNTHFKEQEHSAMVSAFHHVIAGEDSIISLPRTGDILEGHEHQVVFPLPEVTLSTLHRIEGPSSSGEEIQRSGVSQKKYKGVRQKRLGKWVAEIRDPMRKKGIWLGTFGTAEEAARAYDLKAIEFRKGNAKTNFPLADYNHELLSNEKREENDQVNGNIKSCENETDESILTVTATEGESSSKREEDDPLGRIFNNDEEYELPEWKTVDTP